ncbi:hypothetical protein J6590_039863 [Homalodisca vitripennis]|nr:hypothetical protein J6590_039863 [Homalodisca vitripennis]
MAVLKAEHNASVKQAVPPTPIKQNYNRPQPHHALCRRAAALALQQFVERAVNIPHGVEITTAANFHSVGSCSNAYLSVSMEIAQYKEYTESLIKHLLRNKVDYWDCNIRILTAKALHKLASRAPEYMASDVLTELFALIVNDDPKAIHGAVLAIGELVWALSSISQNLLAVKKNKELYETALNQIAKEWERVKSSTPSPSRIRTTVKLKTPSNKNNNPSIGKCSTPLTPISPNQNDSDYPKNNENVLLTCTKDVGVNTPEHLDLNYQLSSLTEKCISLEKSLMDEKSLNTELNESKNGNLKIEKPNTEDFQTLILKQELNKYKTENKNLTLAIELLQNEYKNLEAELNAKNMYNQKCSHCFPPTQIKSQENSWKTVIRSSPYPSNTESKPKLIILGDSHGKNLSLRIEKHTEFNVSAFIRPGANLDQVIEEVRDLSRDLGKNDRLLVIGGTNSVQSTEVMKITDAVHGLVRNTKHTNLILASLPMRHDMPELDIKIARINSELERITEDSEFVDLLPLHLLPRHLYTNHGLHFNNRGKTRIVHLIANLLDREKKTNKIRKEPLNNVPINTDISSTINIVEADMFDTFDQWKMDRTGFYKLYKK